MVVCTVEVEVISGYTKGSMLLLGTSFLLPVGGLDGRSNLTRLLKSRSLEIYGISCNVMTS